MRLQLDQKKITVAMAEKSISATKLATVYGVSRARMNVILNSRYVTPEVAGRLAEALGTDVKDLLVDD